MDIILIWLNIGLAVMHSLNQTKHEIIHSHVQSYREYDFYLLLTNLSILFCWPVWLVLVFVDFLKKY